MKSTPVAGHAFKTRLGVKNYAVSLGARLLCEISDLDS